MIGELAPALSTLPIREVIRQLSFQRFQDHLFFIGPCYITFEHFLLFNRLQRPRTYSTCIFNQLRMVPFARAAKANTSHFLGRGDVSLVQVSTSTGQRVGYRVPKTRVRRPRWKTKVRRRRQWRCLNLTHKKKYLSGSKVLLRHVTPPCESAPDLTEQTPARH